MEMSQVAKCNASTCTYNKQNICHTLGINVGPHAECNTYHHGSARGGFAEVKGGIGACFASDCKFNQQLECKSPNIDVAFHSLHADCQTYQSK
ncbi:MAG: DUF1540 domain-containing protein [Chloroflexi bacterium]|nr:DUF1540 domain-containing protein [Chloroflexota bacterium]